MCKSMEGGKDMILLVSFYITPSKDDVSKQDRETTLSDL